MALIQIRPLNLNDAGWVREFLVEYWLSRKIVSRGRVHSADQLSGFVALEEARRVGLVTYRIEGDECEIVTLNSVLEGHGVGTKLVDEVKSAALSRNCRRVSVVTTNDNLRALGFYQRRGFSLLALHPNALKASRKLKPEIPLIGLDGIPIRDELELEMLLK